MKKHKFMLVSLLLVAVCIISSMNVFASTTTDGDRSKLQGVTRNIEQMTTNGTMTTMASTVIPAGARQGFSSLKLSPGNSIGMSATFSGGSLSYFILWDDGYQGTQRPMSSGMLYSELVMWTVNNLPQGAQLVLVNTGSTNVTVTSTFFGKQ